MTFGQVVRKPSLCWGARREALWPVISMKRPAARPPDAPTTSEFVPRAQPAEPAQFPRPEPGRRGPDQAGVQPGLLRIGLLAAIATIIFAAEVIMLWDRILQG